MSKLSHRLRRALNTASLAHRVHVRKGSGIPYVSHLFAVMYLLSTITDDEDILVAGLLHDTLEDVPENYGEQDMLRDFGPRVLSLVLDVTKDDSLSTWQARADAYLDHLAVNAHPDAVLISVADKTHNLMSILDDYEELGDQLWDRFTAAKQQQQWWYAAVAEVATRRLPGNPLCGELSGLVEQLKAL